MDVYIKKSQNKWKEMEHILIVNTKYFLLWLHLWQ